MADAEDVLARLDRYARDDPFPTYNRLARDAAALIRAQREEMMERDAQWLELIALLEDDDKHDFPFHLPLELGDEKNLSNATDWITTALKNLGVARWEIEQRAALRDSDKGKAG